MTYICRYPENETIFNDAKEKGIIIIYRKVLKIAKRGLWEGINL
jgi:hypothetical protein